MREILPNIYTWSWFSEPHGYDFNGYLILDHDGNLCIDPVPPQDDMAEIERIGVGTILLTNRNHSRATARHTSRGAFDPDSAPGFAFLLKSSRLRGPMART